MVNRHLETVGNELVPAVAYGDAAGLPVETRSHRAIKAAYGTIGSLLPSSENPFYVGEFAPGTWSDDTQLTLVVARSLARVGAFELRDIANLHAEAYFETPQVVKPNKQVVKRGWGGSTTRSIERFLDGVPVDRCGEPQGKGNGVVMKLAPLAFWHVARNAGEVEAYRDCDALTALTHNNLTAKVASRVHHDTLRYLMTNDYTQEAFVQTVIASAKRHEELLGDTSRDVSNELLFLNEHFYFDTETILNNTDGKGFFVPQTLAMAYGAFIAHDGQFAASVYEAVNLGGDTDSTASIVAAMCAIKAGGTFEKPGDYTATSEHTMLCDTSRHLARRALTA